jgi:HD-GYP domain-containing protein (c-di-GMP phosphodiesterase class II)
MLARIFAVADSFDAQTNQRSYNVVHSVNTALEIIRRESGSMYDPKVVREFIAMIKERELPEDAERLPPSTAERRALASSD